MKSDDSAVKTYRIGRFMRATSIGVTIGFVILIVGFLVEVWLKPQASSPVSRRNAVVLVVGIPSVLICCAAFTAFCVRYRLHVSDQRAIQIGLFRKRSVDLAEVTSVVWKRRSDLFVTLHSHAKALQIELTLFDSDDRKELVKFFRARFPPEVQQGWETVCRILTTPKPEPVHWGRVAVGTIAAMCLAVPMLFIAAWISPRREVGLVWEFLFIPSLFVALWIGQKLGWICTTKRASNTEVPV